MFAVVKCSVIEEVNGKVFTQDSPKPTTIQSLSKLEQARLFLVDSMTDSHVYDAKDRELAAFSGDT